MLQYVLLKDMNTCNRVSSHSISGKSYSVVCHRISGFTSVYALCILFVNDYIPSF